MDDDPVRRAPAYQLGTPLDTLSVDELEHTIALLREEIGRIEAAIKAKTASRSVADSVFKF